MANGDPFDGLHEFLAIARRGSIRGAAAELGVTPGAVSQALQGLERRLGLPLFHRTTRRISLTEAGETLLGRLGPAADAITGTIDGLRRMTAEPSGTLRLLAHRMAVETVIHPLIPAFRAACPGVTVDITIDDGLEDQIAGRYDAHIAIGEFIDRDMIAVRVSRPFRWLVAASPTIWPAAAGPRYRKTLPATTASASAWPAAGGSIAGSSNAPAPTAPPRRCRSTRRGTSSPTTRSWSAPSPCRGWGWSTGRS